MLSTDFYYNGQKSVDMGIYLVQLSSGFLSTPFLADKEIIEEKIAGRDKPYLYGVEKQPLVLKLTLSPLEGQWTIEKRRELARWLDTDNYEEFYSVDDITKKYYCQYVSGIDLNYTGSLQGYIEVEMRCDSPWAYSPIYTQQYDFSVNSMNEFSFINEGDDYCQPEIQIQITEAGGFKIENLSDGNFKPFEFTGLVKDEIIYVNNELEFIETSLQDIYRYSNFNDNYLNLKRGVNRLKVTGKCRIELRYQFKVKG